MTEWIETSSGIVPPPAKPVIVCMDNSQVCTATYDDFCGWTMETKEIDPPVAWMPLPEPYTRFDESTFTGRLRASMQRKGLNQKQLAELCNISDTAISHYVKGDRTPSSYIFPKLAKVLGVTTDYLHGV